MMPPDEKANGFTLVELLLSISILVIIVGAISSALIVFLNTGGEASRRDDHTSGAATAASYIDRDVASAAQAAVGTSTCSGKANVVYLSWVDYVATAASPSPSPGPASTSGYGVAYAISSDAASTVSDHAPRYQLERWYCAPGQPAAQNIIVRDLVSTTDFQAVMATSPTCAGGLLKLTLKKYGADTGDDYSSQGCLAGRTR
jgi:prepilin-type N-terminal cleavage/methylation domain-containing protein